MILLFLLFILHWVVWLFTAFYALLRNGRKNLDWLYFAICTSIIFGWAFNKNECIISLIEKSFLDCNYKRGEYIFDNPSLLIYDFGEYSRILILAFFLLQIISFTLVLNDYVDKKIGLFLGATAFFTITVINHFKQLHKLLQ